MTRPYRYDIVGSFLRPESLKQARADFALHKISKEQLTEIEDQAVLELVNKEKEAGLKAVTDGEFRRRMWHMDFLEELNGVQYVDQDNWSVEFKGDKPKGATLIFTDPIDFPDDHSFLDHFRYLRSIAEDTDVKQTIPSPSMLHLIACVRSHQTYQPMERYTDEEVLFTDIANAYIKAVHAFYDLGCRYLQLDDTSWGEFCDPTKRKNYRAHGIDVDQVGQNYVRMINAIMTAKPADMTITMHICRGNFRSSWFSSGGYEPIADILFKECRVDGFFLEYDTDRSGDFRPLSFIKDQKVILGLITSKFAELEDKEEVKTRIREAARYVPLDQLCLSCQCGFSSTEEGNKISEEDQWKKLRLIKEIAEEVWG